MRKDKVTLKEAIKFHGHLGPYLVLGLLAGELGLRKIRAARHFGLAVEVRGADKRPKSCFIDGLQLSTGATYGKANIVKKKGRQVRAYFYNTKNRKKVEISFSSGLIKRLDSLRSHEDSERFARLLYKAGPADIFKLTTRD